MKLSRHIWECSYPWSVLRVVLVVSVHRCFLSWKLHVNRHRKSPVVAKPCQTPTLSSTHPLNHWTSISCTASCPHQTELKGKPTENSYKLSENTVTKLATELNKRKKDSVMLFDYIRKTRSRSGVKTTFRQK